jgi:hypothetical protein
LTVRGGGVEVVRYLSRADNPEGNARPFVTADTVADTVTWLKDLMLSCSVKAVLDCNRAMIEADFRIVPLMSDVRLTV